MGQQAFERIKTYLANPPILAPQLLSSVFHFIPILGITEVENLSSNTELREYGF